MNIILIGAGRIGSTIAYHLAKAGHAVSVVARGARFEALRREGAIVTTSGERASIAVLPALDTGTACDLLIVTVMEHQIDALLPSLSASRAANILLMFNTFEGTTRYRSALGAERFAFAFPMMQAKLVEQRVQYRVDGPGMVTTFSRQDLAGLFKEAGLPTAVDNDMDAYLRSHVAMAVPLFLAALWTWRRPYALTWKEAKLLDAAWTDCFAVVRSLGHEVTPRSVDILSRMPSALRTPLMWLFAKTSAVKDVGEFGPTETRALIDAMVAAAPAEARRLLALRPD